MKLAVDYSAYPHYANQTLEWLDNDSQERFKPLSKNKLFKELGWNKRPVSYKFNAQGFRSDEFTANDSIVFLGCSHAFGFALPYQNTAAKIVADSLNLACYNLSKPAGSFDTCFRFASYWLEKLRPKLVVIIEPEKERMEFKAYSYKTYIHLLPNLKSEYSKFYNDYVFYDVNAEMNRQKNYLAIKYITESIGAKLITVDCTFDVQDKYYARDLGHAGIEPNYKKAQQILEKIHDKTEY